MRRMVPALVAIVAAGCSQGDGSYGDAQARAAMGERGDANPLHHDRYADAEAVAAVTAAGYAAGPHFSGLYADLAGAPDLGQFAVLEAGAVPIGAGGTGATSAAEARAALGAASAAHGHAFAELTGVLASSQLSGSYSAPVTLTGASLASPTVTGTVTLAAATLSGGTFSSGTFSGTGSGLTALNASQLAQGTVPPGRLSGTYGIDIGGNAASANTALRLAGEQGGSTFSDGCVDKSPNPPDCSTCVLGRCPVTSAGYPSTAGWAWLATFTVPADGIIDVLAGPPVSCERAKLTGPVDVLLELRLQERAGFVLPDEGASVHAGTVVHSGFPDASFGWDFLQVHPPLHGRLSTTSDDRPGDPGLLRAGTTYAIYVRATAPPAADLANCFFIQTNVVVRFTPQLTVVAVDPG